MFNQPVDSLRELLISYHAGMREFKGASLEGANLQGVCLQRANLRGRFKSSRLSHYPPGD